MMTTLALLVAFARIASLLLRFHLRQALLRCMMRMIQAREIRSPYKPSIFNGVS